MSVVNVVFCQVEVSATIIGPEVSYLLWCVVVCDLQNSKWCSLGMSRVVAPQECLWIYIHASDYVYHLCLNAHWIMSSSFQTKVTRFTLLLSIFISTYLHVSGNYVPIIRRAYCIYVTLVFFTLGGCLVWGAYCFLVYLFQLLYAFRATVCPSSGELTVSMVHWYFWNKYT